MPYVLRCFPHDDEAFASRAAEGLASFDGARVHENDGIPEALTEILRVTDPLVAVHRADKLAIVVPDQRTLYVYRDGRPTTDR